MTNKTLNEILKECLQDDKKISLYEAKVVREMILADGTVSDKERSMLEEALHKNKFDASAASVMSALILRSDCQREEDQKDKANKPCCG